MLLLLKDLRLDARRSYHASGPELRHLGRGKASQSDLQRALSPLPASKRSTRGGGNGHASVAGGSHARVEISVTRIAQELPLEG